MVYNAWICIETHTVVELGSFSQLWGQGGVDYIVSPFPEHNSWSCGVGF